MTISAVGSPVLSPDTGVNTTLGVSPAAVGNALVLVVRVFNAAETVTAVSGGGCTWTRIVGPEMDANPESSNREIWLGQVTAAGAATITVAYSATPSSGLTELMVQQFSSSLGTGASWAVVPGQITVATSASSTAPTLPSFTASAGQLYFAHATFEQTGSAGSTPGFSYPAALNGHLLVFNPAVSAGSMAPSVASSPAGVVWTAGALISDGVASVPTKIRLGSITPAKFYVGTTAVSKIYQGATQVFGAGGGGGPVEFDAPITINAGGTYTGNWESLDPAVPAVRINTTAPVIIQNSYMRSRGEGIRTIVSNADVTVQNCRHYGLNPGVAGVSPGRFFVSEGFNRVIIDNNDFESSAGIYLVNKAGTGSETDAVKIRRNRVRNIDGRQSTGAGFSTSLSNIAQFVQLDNVVAGGIEIAWNEIVNTPGQCATEDLINIWESRGTSTNKILIHDNFLDGSYPPSAATQGFSGGGIITDGATNTETAWIEVYNNQVVATVNYALAIAAGHDNYMHDNRAVFSGELENGADVAATNVGLYVWNVAGAAGFTNNRIDMNVVGWYQRPANTRNDGWYPDCAVGGCDANTSLHAGAITLADEAAEATSWAAKLASNSVTIGSSLAAL